MRDFTFYNETMQMMMTMKTKMRTDKSWERGTIKLKTKMNSKTHCKYQWNTLNRIYCLENFSLEPKCSSIRLYFHKKIRMNE